MRDCRSLEEQWPWCGAEDQDDRQRRNLLVSVAEPTHPLMNKLTTSPSLATADSSV